MTRRFASARNFLDPELTSDGKPYGPYRYKQLTQERYILVKHAHVTYEDTGKMTPTERKLMLQFLIDDGKRQKEALEAAKNQRANQRKK